MREANENTKKLIAYYADKAELDYQMVLDRWTD